MYEQNVVLFDHMFGWPQER